MAATLQYQIEDDIETLLRGFDCFGSLSADDLTVLASRASTERLPSGRLLFREGDQDPWLFCLLEGSLRLEAADGRSHVLEAGTAAASQPVARLKPRRFTARTVTSVRVLRMDVSELGDWQTAIAHAVEGDGEMPSTPGLLLEEFDVEDIEALDTGPLQVHCQRIESGDLPLPSLPAIAIEASRIIDRDDASAPLLARVLLNDPAITAKLIRAANSPLFYGRGSVDTCERAVLRLGLRTTRQLVVAFALREVFSFKEPALQSLAAALWEHSTAVAAQCFVLARKVGGFDADEAQLAGLVHDIGAVPVLSYAAGDDELREDARATAMLCAELRVRLGQRLLDEWGFSAAMVEACALAENWLRDDVAHADLADLVIVAQAISFIGGPQSQRIPPLTRMPAFRRLFGADAGPEDVLALVADAEQQVQEVHALLLG